ncbi:MAG: aldehyde ferredoxin oxidoreductase family protein [Theionarchaea archaeon]|nr:aldehyde ferredoxin oxidoreductase family protein [Theionarchaea archaeon]
MYSYTGRILRIDLSTSKISEENLNEKDAEKFIGGKGLGVHLLFDNIDPRVDPLSPENSLILCTGPLTGSLAPTSGRWCIVTKSPLTSLFLDSQIGGYFGAEIKKSGYDVIIIRGKADDPVYIAIQDDNVEIRDATHLWGRNTTATEESLKDEGRVLSIGVAGENLVKYACINTDLFVHKGRGGNAGRGGAGAVMGSKNLKAIVIKGTQKIEYAHEEKFRKAVKKAQKIINENSFIPLRRKYGTPVWINPVNENQLLPTYNFLRGYFEKADNISGETMHDTIVVKNKTCFNCPISCGKWTRFDFNGKTYEFEGPEYESIALLGSNCGNETLEGVAYLSYLCDEYGLDTISAGNVVGFAVEAAQKKIIDQDIGFNDPVKQGELLRKIAYREGIGNDLAEGVNHFSEKRGGKDFAMQSKGMEFPGYDPRGAFGMALAYATSDRGACHQRVWTVRAEIEGNLQPRYSIKGRAEFVKENQDERACCFSLVLCDFAPFDVGMFVELLNTATGFEYTKETYMRTGERIWNLTKMFNVKNGITRKDETIPERIMKENLEKDEAHIGEERFEKMLDEYYELRGWDANGIPTKEKLKELNLVIT